MNALQIKSPKNIVLVHKLSVILAVLASLGLLQSSGAQEPNVVISGRVLSADYKVPLERAHVFIASSMIGTATDRDGRFTLENVPPGAHRILITMLGYTSFQQDSLFHPDHSYTLDIELEPASIILDEVTISAREARRWQRRSIKFSRLLLGETPNSDSTEIINPEVLSFTSRRGKFSATASAPLIIHNRALGYELVYHLKEFISSGVTIKWDGDPFYTELEPDDSAQAKRWKENRISAFYGSERHFFLSLLDGITEEEGFFVYRRAHLDQVTSRFLVEPDDLLRDGPTPLEKELTFSRFLEIIYTKEKESRTFQQWSGIGSTYRQGDQQSFMKLNDGPTLVDHEGEVIDPYGITVYGYYAFERLADRLPKEYRPPEWERSENK